MTLGAVRRERSREFGEHVVLDRPLHTTAFILGRPVIHHTKTRKRGNEKREMEMVVTRQTFIKVVFFNWVQVIECSGGCIKLMKFVLQTADSNITCISRVLLFHVDSVRTCTGILVTGCGSVV